MSMYTLTKYKKMSTPKLTFFYIFIVSNLYTVCYDYFVTASFPK